MTLAWLSEPSRAPSGITSTSTGRPQGRPALQPSFCEHFIGRHLPLLLTNQAEPIAQRFSSIPGTVFGNEDLIPILLGKHVTGVKTHADGGHMGTQVAGGRSKFLAAPLLAKFGIGNVPSMAVRITKVESGTSGAVELIRWAIIPQPVAAIIGKPEFFGFRTPVKTHRVSNTAGKDFQPRSVGPHAQHGGIALICRPAGVTGCSNRNV